MFTYMWNKKYMEELFIFLFCGYFLQKHGKIVQIH